VLLEELLQPLEVTQHRLAMSIAVPPRRINEIVHGKWRITADTALRLPRYFGTTDRFWLNLQTRYDLETEKENLGPALDGIRPLRSARPPPMSCAPTAECQCVRGRTRTSASWPPPSSLASQV
jgi:addiction module HigA family antidote